MEIVLPARAGHYFSTPRRVMNESKQLGKSFEAVCQIFVFVLQTALQVTERRVVVR